MSVRLEPGRSADAARVVAPLEPVGSAQVVSGSPSAGFVELDATSRRSIGVWEHTPGESTDVEEDEVFVVLSGDATVSFTDRELPPIELRAGVVVRLEAGMHTVWTVRETLRKVFIAP